MKLKNYEIKAIIFDLDGTLLNSCGVWQEVDREFFKKRNIEQPDDYAKAIGHLGLDKAADYTINRFHLQEKKEDIINEWKSKVVDIYSYEVKLKPYVKEFLLKLKQEHVQICVATANSSECYRGALINNGIYDEFSFILEVTKFSKGKEDPAIYNACKEKLGVKANECAVFEDLPLAIDTANKAGFITVGVYDEYCDEEELKQKISKIYINNFSELL